jgi:hypothetical protein
MRVDILQQQTLFRSARSKAKTDSEVVFLTHTLKKNKANMLTLFVAVCASLVACTTHDGLATSTTAMSGASEGRTPVPSDDTSYHTTQDAKIKELEATRTADAVKVRQLELALAEAQLSLRVAAVAARERAVEGVEQGVKQTTPTTASDPLPTALSFCAVADEPAPAAAARSSLHALREEWRELISVQWVARKFGSASFIWRTCAKTALLYVFATCLVLTALSLVRPIRNVAGGFVRLSVVIMKFPAEVLESVHAQCDAILEAIGNGVYTRIVTGSAKKHKTWTLGVFQSDVVDQKARTDVAKCLAVVTQLSDTVGEIRALLVPAATDEEKKGKKKS